MSSTEIAAGYETAGLSSLLREPGSELIVTRDVLLPRRLATTSITTHSDSGPRVAPQLLFRLGSTQHTFLDIAGTLMR